MNLPTRARYILFRFIVGLFECEISTETQHLAVSPALD